jgi:hypothetical protein
MSARLDRRLHIVLTCALFVAGPASAQESPWPREPPKVQARAAEEPSAARTGSPRLYAGVGLEIVSGPQVKLNGETLRYNRVSGDLIGPGGPVGMLRLDVPLHRFLLLGVQGALTTWSTTTERTFAYGPHVTFDVSGVARFRLGLGSYRRHEIVASIALGPSFDVPSTAPRNFGESIDSHVGVHVGGFVSYQYFPLRSPLGVFVEGGLTYHHVTQTNHYEIEGRSSRDELSYHPSQVFLRGGLMLVFFR